MSGGPSLQGGRVAQRHSCASACRAPAGDTSRLAEPVDVGAQRLMRIGLQAASSRTANAVCWFRLDREFEGAPET